MYLTLECSTLHARTIDLAESWLVRNSIRLDVAGYSFLLPSLTPSFMSSSDCSITLPAYFAMKNTTAATIRKSTITLEVAYSKSLKINKVAIPYTLTVATKA